MFQVWRKNGSMNLGSFTNLEIKYKRYNLWENRLEWEWERLVSSSHLSKALATSLESWEWRPTSLPKYFYWLDMIVFYLKTKLYKCLVLGCWASEYRWFPKFTAASWMISVSFQVVETDMQYLFHHCDYFLSHYTTKQKKRKWTSHDSMFRMVSMLDSLFSFPSSEFYARIT